MKIKRRWMRWVFDEVETFDTRMPWERGYARKGWKKKPTVLSAQRLLARG